MYLLSVNFGKYIDMIKLTHLLYESYSVMWNKENSNFIASLLNAKIVGSVAEKGTSNHDLDLLVDKYDGSYHNFAVRKLKELGFEFNGSMVISPAEAKKSGKLFGVGWQRVMIFINNEKNKKIEIWYRQKNDSWDPSKDLKGKLYENNDQDHQNELDKTGFWGKQGAGSIIMAKTTGRLLIQKRSDFVEEPGTWGTWGGAIDSNLSPVDGATKEFEEETGKSKTYIREKIPLYVFKHPTGFSYYNFLFVVDDEFIPHPTSEHDWEVGGFKWVEFGEWPNPLHFGLIELLKHDFEKVKSIIKKNQEYI